MPRFVPMRWTADAYSWSNGAIYQPIVNFQPSYGTMTKDVAFPLTISLTGDVYVFFYRNQPLGTVTPTNMVQVVAADSGSGRMSIWKVTGPNPALRASGNTALVSWIAVQVGLGAISGAALAYAAANGTAQVDAPQDGGTARTLVVYAANNYAYWNEVGEFIYTDGHEEVRPSIMAAYFPKGPPLPTDRGLEGMARIEGAAAVWWT